MGVNVGDLFLDLNINSDNLSKQLNSAAYSAQNYANKAFSGMGKTIATALSTAAIGSFVSSCLDLGSDLQEVQNVVDVTFPHMSKQIDTFSKNAIDSFGLSETVAKRMTGTYGAMAKAFGFSESAAYDMATSLTGLAGDVASFYNLDPTEAYTKLKSVFSGETETLKDLGIVMTQNALDQFALAKGYGKTTSAMSEQEKVSLRLAFVTEQLNAASGDFARTSDSWANKIKVLNLNFQSLKATIGQGLINVLSPVVSLLNTIIQKFQIAANYFAAFTSLLSGNKKTATTLGSVSNSLDTSASGASALADNLNSVGASAKKASKQMGFLASFDEINNITTNDSSEGGGGGVSGIDISSGVNEALSIDTSSAEESIDNLQSKVQSFTNFFKTNQAVILSLIGGIVAGFATFGLIKNFSTLSSGVISLLTVFTRLQTGVYTFFTQLMSGQGIMTAFSATFGTALGPVLAVSVGVAAVSAALVYLYQTSEGFRNSVNEAVTGLMGILSSFYTGILQPVFSFLVDFYNIVIQPIATFIAKVFVKAVELIAKTTLSFWNNVLDPLANFLVNALSVALQGALEVWESWKPWVEELFANLDWLWSDILSPLADYIADAFSKTFENWGRLIEQLIPNAMGIFQGLIDFFVGIFTNDTDKAWSGITTIFENFDNFLQTIFAMDWRNIFGNELGNVLNYFFSIVSDIWNGIKGIFSGIIKFVTGVFTADWKKAWQGVSDIFSSIASGFANIFKKPINAIIDGINSFIGGLNKIKIPDWVPGVGGKGFYISKIPRLAEGGYVKANTPQLAMIGDNKTQGEIVSPEDKMYEVMIAALKAYGSNNANREDIQVLVSIMYEILEAIKNLRLIVDGDSLNDDMNKRDLERALRTGITG